MRPLTARQAEVLAAIKAHVAAKGYPPTHRELAGQLGIALTTVRQHMRLLGRKGVIESVRTDDGRALARTLTVAGPRQGEIELGGGLPDGTAGDEQ